MSDKFVNRVDINGETVIDLSGDTVDAQSLLKGVLAHDNTGRQIIGELIASGGGLPSGISAIKFGTDTISSDFTTTRRTVTHNLGVKPDLVFYWHNGNIATTYSTLWAMRFSQLGYRSSAYDSYMAYHPNSTTTVTITNSNSTTYGVSNLTATTFQLASSSSSYYWRAGTYNWIAIKFS